MDLLKYLKNSDTYKLVTSQGQKRVDAYGTLWPVATPLSIELTAYRYNWQGNSYNHLKNAHDIIWPQDVKTWNYWTERRFRAHCEGHKIITMAGGANCGKSWDVGKIALLFWLANPMERTILVASTSLSDLDTRIWGYIKKFYNLDAKVDLAGTMFLSPPPKILMNKKDTVHGMFAVPLQRGAPSKTASTLIGRHPTDGFLAVIDEGTDVNPGFMEAVPNWEKAPYFQMIVIGNSASMFDPHGLLSTPINGWDSINRDYDKEWAIKDGVCLYFNCYDSPAITEKDEQKKQLLAKFLFTTQSIEEAKIRYGENSPGFWRFTRGFWPPEDVAQTILTSVMVDKFKIKDLATWSGLEEQYMIAGLDPAFNPDGDDCILRFAILGHTQSGRWVLDYGGEENVHKLIIDANSPEPAPYQIVHKTMQLCQEMGCKPENLAVDVWGPGTGLGAIFETVWSPHIYKVSSAGQPSDAWVDADKTMQGKDAYDRRITELWFSMQQFVQAGQIKGLDAKSCEQFCTRKYDWKGRRYAIETKEDYKIRLGKVDSRYVSPDRADAAALILDLVRQFFGFIPHGILRETSTDASSLQKYFNQKYMDGEGPTYGGGPTARSGHPSTWEDGFTTADVEGFEEESH